MAEDKVAGKDSWVPILGAIRNPLTFFALALLMVESLIGVLSAMGSGQLLVLSLLATSMFTLVVLSVTWLVATHARELLAQSPSELVETAESIVNKLKDRLDLEKKAPKDEDVKNLIPTGQVPKARPPKRVSRK